MRVRQAPPLALHHEIEAPNGRFYRWGKDEPRPENVPSNHGFDTTAPGGFDTDRITLPRKPGVDYSDIERLSTLRALGAGGEVACETRLKSTPRTSGDEFSIGPESEGWIAHLQDDPTAAEIYIDAALSGWGEPSTQRKNDGLEVYGWDWSKANISQGFQDTGSAAPALLAAFAEFAAQAETAEAWYYGGGVDIGAVRYDFIVPKAGGEPGGTNNFLFLAVDDRAKGATIIGTNHHLTPTANQSVGGTGAGGFKYAGFQSSFTGAYTGVSGGDSYGVSNLRVIGNHGLPIYGTWPMVGLLASDAIVYALARWAPALRFTTGPSGSLRPSSNVIPHLVFKEKTTALVVLEGANRYELRNYAVWENQTFHYHDWGDRGRKWRTRVAPSQLSETGPTLDRTRNGVVMTWSDVDGSQRSAGPPGSGCDVEDVRLQDLDPENPANQRGIRMWGQPIDVGISVESEVIRVGALYLQRLKETDTSGQMQLVGTVEDDRGIVRPAWQVRAGDTIVPVDASDTRERRIIRTSYNEDTLTNTIDLDAPPDGTPDLLAQLGVSVSDLGV